MKLISELKRRNVLRVGAAYLLAAWLIIQIVETILPVYGFSDAAIRLVITTLVIGLVPVLVFAWAFEMTPEGIKRDAEVDHSAPVAPRNDRIFDRLIMVMLALGIGYFALDKFVFSQARELAIAEAAREQGRSEAIGETFGARSIAVLAFDDMSPAGDQEYLSDGLAEEILNLLSKVPDLRVISRSSAFSFKGKKVPIPEIASQLNTAYVLEGSVRTSGKKIRVTAQLIEATSDSHRWSKTYDRELVNVFDIQDEIAASVVEELKSTLLGDMPKSQRADQEAYILALQARFRWWRRNDGDAEAALDLYQQAVQIDPDYVPALTGLSVALLEAVANDQIMHEEGLRKARVAIERALALEPESAEVQVRLGQVLSWYPEERGMSIKLFEKAYSLDPNNPLTLAVNAMQAVREGRIDDVIALYEQAEAIDPLSAIWPSNKSYALIRFRRADEAEVAVRRAYELNQNSRVYLEHMTDIHNIRGEYDKALEALAELPIEEFNLTRKAIALYGAGRVEESNVMLEQMKGIDIPEAKLGVAQVYSARGDNDLAFEWLKKIDTRQLSSYSIVYDVYTRTLTDDPRWKPFVDSLDWRWAYRY